MIIRSSSSSHFEFPTIKLSLSLSPYTQALSLLPTVGLLSLFLQSSPVVVVTTIFPLTGPFPPSSPSLLLPFPQRYCFFFFFSFLVYLFNLLLLCMYTCRYKQKKKKDDIQRITNKKNNK